MHRFFVTDTHDNHVSFSKAQAHQIRNVLRLQPGRRVIALDNAGWEYEAVLTGVERNWATAEIVEKRPASGEPAVHITLHQSLIKQDRFEWALQKCTEMGATRFTPLVTQRSLVRNPEAITPKKMARWQRILTEAAEQSRRGRIPELVPAVKLEQAVAALDPAQLLLMPWAQGEGMSLRAALEQSDDAPASIALFIGPEGGFTEAEVAYGRQHNIIPITLGKRILRAETAAVVTTALILYELGEMT